MKYCDGSTQKFDGLSGKTGTFFGSNANVGKPVAGVWVKSGCNKSGDGPGYGEWFANPQADCNTPEPCDCPYTATDFRCDVRHPGGGSSAPQSTWAFTRTTSWCGTGTVQPDCDPTALASRPKNSVSRMTMARSRLLPLQRGLMAGPSASPRPGKWLLIRRTQLVRCDGWMVHVEETVRLPNDNRSLISTRDLHCYTARNLVAAMSTSATGPKKCP